MIAGHAYIERDPDGAFFWVRSGGSWDLFRHDDTMVVDLIQAEYFRKYGVVVPDYYMATALAAHRLRAKFDGLRVDRVWKRAGFDGQHPVGGPGRATPSPVRDIRRKARIGRPVLP